MVARAEQKEYTQFDLVPTFGGLEMLRARYQHMQFPKHIHETYCISVIEEGVQRFYRSGAEHVAPTGDIIIVNAEDVHTGSAALASGWGYRAIYPHPSLLQSLLAEVHSEAGTVPWFDQAVIHDPELAQQLRLAFGLLQQPRNTLLKETTLAVALTQLMLRHARLVADRAVMDLDRPLLWRVRDYLHADPGRDFSLTELAELAQLSPWHFLRQFQRLFGLTPHAYLLQVRIRLAKQRLRQGQSIASVAQQCGFTDQSHLNRHFKKTVGVTPGAFVQGFKPRVNLV
ncbi:MAG: AraC family ligand binding domain-containing protein [Neisseriaceae bacterium]